MGAILMKINIICVGSIKEKFYSSAINEYIKRLNKFHSVNIIEVQEEKLTKNYSQSDIAKVIVKEGIRIDKYLKGYNICLDIIGKQMDSVEFSLLLDKIALSNGVVNFVIGGSFGISEEVKKKCDMSLSFSKMTFPHQLFRVILLEQIYRATTITQNILYHK